MTDQDINEAVARKLGWTWDGCSHEKEWRFPGWVAGNKWLSEPRDYCHSIEAAFEILKDKAFVLSRTPGGFNCTVYPKEQLFPGPDIAITKSADTAPMAICLAFLKLP